MQAEKCIADDEEEKVGMIAEEVSKKQKGWHAVFIPYHTYTHTVNTLGKKYLRVFGVCFFL